MTVFSRYVAVLIFEGMKNLIISLLCIACILPKCAYPHVSNVWGDTVKAMTGIDVVAASPDAEQPKVSVAIVGTDIPETGITSVYKVNEFCISSANLDITDIYWKLELPLPDGNTAIYCSSDSEVFSIPAFDSFDKYEHNAEKRIEGVVKFSGKADGTHVESEYKVAFELKPLLLKAEIVDRQPCDYDGTYYNALLNICYKGSRYVHVYVEEDGSSTTNTYFSDTPLSSQILLCDIDSRVNANANIVIRNDYGETNAKVSLPCDGNLNGIQDVSAQADGNIPEFACIEVYDHKGTRKPEASTLNDIKVLAPGLYIIKFVGKDGKLLATRKIRK